MFGLQAETLIAQLSWRLSTVNNLNSKLKNAPKAVKFKVKIASFKFEKELNCNIKNKNRSVIFIFYIGWRLEKQIGKKRKTWKATAFSPHSILRRSPTPPPMNPISTFRSIFSHTLHSLRTLLPAHCYCLRFFFLFFFSTERESFSFSISSFPCPWHLVIVQHAIQLLLPPTLSHTLCFCANVYVCT